MKRVVLLCALFALSTLAAFAADITGKWTGEGGRGGTQTFTFKQDGSALTGTVEGGRGGATQIKNGKVDGDNLSFEVSREMGGNSITIKYSGSVSGSSMKLSFDAGRGARDMTLTKQ